MESMRGFFILGFAICTFLLYQAWQKDYGPQSQQQEVNEQFGQKDAVVDSEIKSSNLIEVVTDVFKVKIDRVGGDVVYAELNDYNRELDSEKEKVVLFDYRDRLYQAKSALLGNGAPDNQLPRATYQVKQNAYQLADGKNELEIPLTWVNEDGVEFTKTFKFKRDDYEIGVEYKVKNQSSNDRTYNFVAELIRDQKPTGLEEKSSFGMSPFIGVAYSPEERKYEKMSVEDLVEEPINVTRQGGWIGYLQHYFISAWIPEQQEQIKVTTTVKSNQDTVIRFIQPTVSVPAQSESVINATLYVGPKILKRLEAAAPGLEKSLDLSWVWWIGLPLYKLMQFFFSFVGNWGLAIILVTLVVKALLYPLSAAQYRSMANMRKLAPKMQQLKERYGEDKQRMQQEMMKMYKDEGANPFGGCLPMILQFPIFIALYYVLFEAVELRHAPFVAWIQDLSVADPYFVLPLLMGGSMWLMQKLQPQSPTMDPMQQKIMSYLPIVFTVFMLFFPAGLVLYWLCNNLISVAQQQYITKKIEKQHAAKSK
ncbi:membrane protein insertase YidC [Kangiella koreensis]|uniref:Membrane protein insertase YidC n=1 Tax=Kangiella koreensis (strain DSM 16069 / JCM 12317 / KCTC 12182 / SW-125) TaxID=523791 RepID=C7RAF8_KANKD|nr:membrane protein insertase YidC [Kangiella koreensis]ACV28052.1 60 kDa inner membrane insertion protein [Kangiella koreensis DSM 16069]